MVAMWIDSTLAGLMAGVQAMVGSDRFNLALQSQGRNSVKGDWHFISQHSDFRSGFAALSTIATVAGWGNWELLSLDWDKQECRFRMKNTWEGRYQKALGVCWGSSFLAGKLAGYCAELFGTNCWAEQTAFIARGDEFDEFVVQPSQRSIEEEIDKLLATDEATRADVAVALEKLNREVAERKRTEEILRQNEQRYRSLVLATSQIVWRTNAEGKFDPVIPTWSDYTGQSEEEVKGWGWLKAVHPDDRDRSLQNWSMAIETKTAYENEYRLRGKNGTYRYFAVRGVPVLEEDGQIREWVGTCIDIQERKQAEQELLHYQVHLADLVLERTAELAKTNQKLQQKIIQLQQVESERSIALAQEQAARSRAEALVKERDETLDRLRQSEERYRSLVAATSQIVWVTNAEGIEPDMPTWLSYTGQTQAEIQNWGWLDAVHPEDRDRAARDWYLAVNTKTYFDTEYRLRRIDGIYRYFSVRGVPVIAADGSIREWVGVCTDIHDRKLAEEALRQSEARFQRLVANVPGVICQWRLHPDGSVSLPYISSGCRELQELEPEEMQQNPNLGLDITHPDDRGIMERAIAISGQTLQPINSQVRIVTRSGKIKWVQVAARPEKEASGAILWDCLTTDITDRKCAEEALRKSEAKFRALYEATSLAVAMGDENGMFDCNTAYMRLFGYADRQDCYGKHPADLSPPYQPDGRDSWSVVNEKIAIAFEQGSHRFEWVHRRLDGTDFPAEVVLTAIELGNRKIFQAVIEDLTERKAAEEYLRQSEAREKERVLELEQTLHKLQRTQSQLIQSEKMSSLGQLVAGVAHEINNPVNFIYGNLVYASQYTEELLEVVRLYQQHYPQPVTEVQKEIEAIDFDFLMQDFPRLLSSMKVGAERIREIVLSLRNFSRLDEAEKKAVNIHEGIDSTLMILQNRLKGRTNHPPIQVIKGYGDLPKVECYPGQLNQVFMNLLSNAIDALEIANRECDIGNGEISSISIDGFQPQISICTEVNNNWVTIRIADNGPGMKEEVRKRLFDPFFTTKPVGKGTGLGLAISYQIVVEKHGGQLKCISEPGQGAEFAIKIPIKQSR